MSSFFVRLSHITCGVVSEPGVVGLLRVAVAFAGKNALATDCFQAQSYPADASEQVDELKRKG